MRGTSDFMTLFGITKSVVWFVGCRSFGLRRFIKPDPTRHNKWKTMQAKTRFSRGQTFHATQHIKNAKIGEEPVWLIFWNAFKTKCTWLREHEDGIWDTVRAERASTKIKEYMKNLKASEAAIPPEQRLCDEALQNQILDKFVEFSGGKKKGNIQGQGCTSSFIQRTPAGYIDVSSQPFNNSSMSIDRFAPAPVESREEFEQRVRAETQESMKKFREDIMLEVTERMGHDQYQNSNNISNSFSNNSGNQSNQQQRRQHHQSPQSNQQNFQRQQQQHRRPPGQQNQTIGRNSMSLSHQQDQIIEDEERRSADRSPPLHHRRLTPASSRFAIWTAAVWAIWTTQTTRNAVVFNNTAASVLAVVDLGSHGSAESGSLWTLFCGFPVWLKYVPGISFRTDNGPFKAAMEGFTKKIVEMMKNEKLFQSQGGPIILSQVVIVCWFFVLFHSCDEAVRFGGLKEETTCLLDFIPFGLHEEGYNAYLQNWKIDVVATAPAAGNPTCNVAGWQGIATAWAAGNPTCSVAGIAGNSDG
ncbi:hypothetical protein P8452_71724 [Trifolium repens]|nr:hypothetical protein P8452_71724 [Trifolium repens]